MARFLDLSILRRNRSYSLLYGGQFVSFLGNMISVVAIPYQVYHATHSTVMVGVLSLIQMLPLLLTALLGGVLADRYSRRPILLISEVILAIGCLFLAFNAQWRDPSLAVIFIIASLMSALMGLHRPAYEGIIQQLVRQEDYKTVGALRAFQFSFCMIVGPAIAGLIVDQYGIAITYYLDFSTFLFSLMCLVRLGDIPKPPSTSPLSMLSALKEGVAFALQREALLGSYYVDFIAMVCAMPNALFPAIALSIGGVKTLGLLYAAPAVGALLLSIWSGWSANIKHEGQAIAISAGCWGIAIIGFGCTQSLPIALLCLVIAGAADASSGIFRASLWNRTVPQAFRGRLAGIELISYLSGPKLGDLRAGVAASMFGIGPAIISGGVLCLIGVGLCAYRMKQFWLYSGDH